ncbi:Uncharacterised protein [Enterobacter cancerogenus]|uniref:Uncharacterized protein n=1 Tax=Enterobacter cancerogenus TaxID=69218 RepID=A0A484Z943_9ENTR|nr:Uncharacterised protein [Enterobacter cancerogenus]
MFLRRTGHTAPLSQRERGYKVTYRLNGDAADTRAWDTASPSCHTAIA